MFGFGKKFVFVLFGDSEQVVVFGEVGWQMLVSGGRVFVNGDVKLLLCFLLLVGMSECLFKQIEVLLLDISVLNS